MVKIFQIFFLLVAMSFFAQIKNDSSILGKWQLIASSGSNGAKNYTNEVKNGEILFFQSKNQVSNEKDSKGTYQLNGDKLKIMLRGLTKHYLLYHDEKNNTIFFITPVTDQYQIICDEGCSFTYTKI